MHNLYWFLLVLRVQRLDAAQLNIAAILSRRAELLGLQGNLDDITELSDVFIDVDGIDNVFLSLSCVPERRIVEPKRCVIGRRGDHEHFEDILLTADLLQQLNHRRCYPLPLMTFNNFDFVEKHHRMGAINPFQLIGKGEPNWLVILDGGNEILIGTLEELCNYPGGRLSALDILDHGDTDLQVLGNKAADIHGMTEANDGFMDCFSIR